MAIIDNIETTIIIPFISGVSLSSNTVGVADVASTLLVTSLRIGVEASCEGETIGVCVGTSVVDVACCVGATVVGSSTGGITGGKEPYSPATNEPGTKAISLFALSQGTTAYSSGV